MHAACVSSLFTHCSFDTLKNYTLTNDTLIIIEVRIICKNFSIDLKKHGAGIINHKKGNDIINK